MRGSVVRRDGKRGASWYVVLSVAGKRRWIKVPEPATKASAERYRTRLLAEMDRGDRPVADQRVTLAEFAGRWREAHFPSLAPKTRWAYDAALASILPALGARAMRSLGREDIESWRATISASYAPSTTRHMMRVLSVLLRAAVVWRYLPVSPMDGLRTRSARQREIRPLTPDEVRCLLAVADAQWRALVLFAVTGGLRAGEICAARWEYLDLAAQTYRVAGTAIQLPGWDEVTAPKTSGSATVVHLSAAACAALQALLVAQDGRSLAGSTMGSGWLFTRPDGRRYTPSVLRYEWVALQATAGIETHRLHDLRHTCAAWLVEAGGHPKLIQEQMRHASIATTLDTYGHLFPKRAAEVVDRLDGLLKA